MHNRYAARSRHNSLPLYGFNTCVTYREGNTVAAHPFQLALAILGARPCLPVKDWLDSDLFWADWERAGFPGLRGSVTIRLAKGWVSSPRRYLPYSGGPEGFKTYEWEHWVALKPFRRWLLRRYPVLLESPKVRQRRHARETANLHKD